MPSPRSLPRRVAAFAAAGLFSLGALALSFHGTARASVRSAVHSAAGDATLPAIVRRALGMPDVRWVRAESAQVALYAAAGSRAAANLDRARAEAEAARAADLATLGVPAFPRQLHLVYLKDRAQMRTLAGYPAGGTAEPEQYAAVFVTNDSVRAPVRHELMHVLAADAWGPPAGDWLREGLATHAVGGCGGRSLHTIAAALDREHRLLPLADLPRRFDVRGEAGAVMYVQSGSLVQYVADRYGTDRLRDFYRSGLAAAPTVLGVDAAALERAWLATVRRHAGRDSWAQIDADIVRHGCE